MLQGRSIRMPDRISAHDLCECFALTPATIIPDQYRRADAACATNNQGATDLRSAQRYHRGRSGAPSAGDTGVRDRETRRLGDRSEQYTVDHALSPCLLVFSPRSFVL